MKDLKIEIGKRVLQARKELGLTQVQIENRAEISQGYISHVEKGNQNPSFDFLLKLAKTYDLSIDWLIFGVGQMKMLPKDHILNRLNPRQIQLLQKILSQPPESQDKLLNILTDIMDYKNSS